MNTSFQDRFFKPGTAPAKLFTAGSAHCATPNASGHIAMGSNNPTLTMHPIRPINRPNPAAIARRQAITGMILDMLGSAAIGAVIALMFFR